MRIYKKSFITIPDAPNYEINGYFKIRNKKTGRFVKGRSKHNANELGSVLITDINKRQRSFGVIKLYRRAVEAAKNEDGEWALIGIVNNLYEMNLDGVVRNVETKKILKPQEGRGGKYYNLCIDGKSTRVCLKRLFNSAFDMEYKLRPQKVPVCVRKGGRAYYFETIRAAAQFLAPKLFYSRDHIARLMGRRQKEIYGYEITYLR